MVAEIISPPPSTTTTTENGNTTTNEIVEVSDVVGTDSTHSRSNVVSVPSTPEPSVTMFLQRRQGSLDPPESMPGGIPVDTDDDEVAVQVEEQAIAATNTVDPSVSNNIANERIFSPRADVSVATITSLIRTSPIISNQQQPDTTSSNTIPSPDHRGRTVFLRDSIGTNTATAPPNVTGSTTPSVIPTTTANNNNNSYHTRQQPQLHSPMSSTIAAAQPSHLATTPRSIVTSSSILSSPSYTSNPNNIRCINPASEINARLDTQVEVRVYPCNTSAGQKKKFTSFTIKPEGVIIQGSNRNHNQPNRSSTIDLGTEYATQIGRKLCRYELADTRACQLLVTTHGKNFWVVPAPEAFSRHSGTCRLLGDRKHPPAQHTMQVGDFLRVGSVGVVVIETHDGITNCILSEEKIQRIMKDTTATGGFLDLAETDGENSDDSMDGQDATQRSTGDVSHGGSSDHPVCYMCFDEEDTAENPMITPCKCSGDTKYVHVECLRKWHTAEADNQICFLSSVDATCSVCKSTFKSDFKLSDGRQVKLFKSSLEPPYVSLLVATKHEMAQRLFNTRFQLSFSTLMKPDGRNATRPLLLGRSSGSDMVLDYRTVSARHAAIRFKNGEFVFTDAGSSNGSYLYLRRPLELSPSQAVQFRLGRSMISMKVVNKWNRRLLRAVRGQRSATATIEDEVDGAVDDRSIGSVDGDIRITAENNVEAVQRRTRESVMASLPPPGLLSQSSAKHLDFLFALAYPKREPKNKMDRTASSHSATTSPSNMTVGVAPASTAMSPMATASVTTAAAIAGRSNVATPVGTSDEHRSGALEPIEQVTH